LKELNGLLQQTDDVNNAYPEYLPTRFTSQIIFAESRNPSFEISDGALRVLSGTELTRGYAGAAILRDRSFPSDYTANCQVCAGAQEIFAQKHISRDAVTKMSRYLTGPFTKVANEYRAVGITWSLSGFAEFAFDMLASLNGTWKPGRVSTYHGKHYGPGTWRRVDKASSESA
jgi:hypothetical protein